MPIEKGDYIKLGEDKSTKYLKNPKLSDGLFELGNSKFSHVQSVNSMSRIGTYTELTPFYY